MGDVSQNINFGSGLSDWEDLKKVMLPDKYDYFGLLKKSYRNTVEISQFATDILRHATFPIYPVEPIVRHGEEVECRGYDSKEKLSEAVLKQARRMKDKEYETIAVICKDAYEAKEVFEYLDGHIDVKYFSGEDIEFSSGIYVIPIEYSKGLEFDAVIIYDASNEAYPKQDGYAKLLYVAATRALHELCVFYRGSLTGLVADPIPEDRKNITFEDDDFHIKPVEFEEQFKTKEEIAKEQANEGDIDRVLREKYGPKTIEVKEKKPQAKKAVLKNKVVIGVKTGIITPVSNVIKDETTKSVRSSEFGSAPESTSLKPIGHGKINNSIRWINKDKTKLEIVTGYGILSIIPVSDETVRITFSKEDNIKLKPLPNEVKYDPQVKWLCADMRDCVEIRLNKLTVRIDKKSGALSFVSKKGTVLLTENTNTSRQYHEVGKVWWNYFDWGKKEKLSARSKDPQSWMDLCGVARYISHGNDEDPALLMSGNGYQILVASRIKVMSCTVMPYGNYLRFEDTPCIDYIFRTFST